MNHNSFEAFINHPSMFSIKMRAIFVHVDLMGQEDHAEDLPDNAKFPTLQEIGEDLVNILDVLQIKCVIGMGEGAGANIMFRFGVMHVTRCLGIICVNPTGASAGMKVNFTSLPTEWGVESVVNFGFGFYQFSDELNILLSSQNAIKTPLTYSSFVNAKCMVIIALSKFFVR